MIDVAPEVGEALADGRAVVALETTLVAHGFPAGAGLDVALEAERRVRAAGAVPATIGVVDGSVRVGLSATELERFAAAGESARKVAARDLAAAVVQGALGATTVSGTLAACGAAGIHFIGTGGLGGVHRGFAEHLDISGDVPELARQQVLVVASGVKSLLDVPATVELLETLGVPVVGWRTATVPLFYTAAGGPAAAATVDTPEAAASLADAHWSLARGGVLLARPPDDSLEVEPLIEAGLAEAVAAGVSGPGLTPFVLAHVHRASGGESVRINKRLIADNAGLAGEVAAAYAAIRARS